MVQGLASTFMFYINATFEVRIIWQKFADLQILAKYQGFWASRAWLMAYGHLALFFAHQHWLLMCEFNAVTPVQAVCSCVDACVCQ